MDDAVTTVPDGPVASAPPPELVLALAVPVIAVVAWFLARLTMGRWVTDPAPDLGGDDDADGVS